MDALRSSNSITADPLDKLNSQTPPTEITQRSFEDVLETQQLLPNNAGQRIKLLEVLHELHQRAQITGVPTSMYNAAVQALGLDPVANPFAGAQALQAAGFETGAPSIGAILEFGATPSAHGNQSYLARETAPESRQTSIQSSSQAAAADELPQPELGQEFNLMPNEQAIRLELAELNEQYDQLLGSAGNYFEAASVLAQRLDIKAYTSFTLSQALPLIQVTLADQVALKTAASWLQSK